MTAALRFTGLMVNNEISVLRRLHGMLETSSVEDRSQFNDLMCAAFEHGKLDYRDLSNELGYNASTVHRWIDGKSAPHPGVWPRIIEWIMSAIEERIDAYEAEIA